MSERLATNRQLWALNQAGRLAVVEKAEPLTAQTAKEVISELKASARLSLARDRSSP